MPAQQRTFDLVPTTLVKSNAARPPTTSKAAKKAYQQANKGPRISRAEQRRRDAAELERQKKEFEREKAAARAKAAREKKAAKANAEKEERRKKGLPEPSRFVRASQPTISRFVRSGSGKRSWKEMETNCVEEDSDDTLTETVAELNNESEPPAKRTPMEAESDVTMMETVLDLENAKGSLVNKIFIEKTLDDTMETIVGSKHEEERPARQFAMEEESEDEFGDFPSLSQIDILEQIDSSIFLAKEIQKITSSPHVPDLAHLTPHQSPELPKRKIVDDEYPFDSQVFSEMANTQLLSEATEAALKSDVIEPQSKADQPAQMHSARKPVIANPLYDTPLERRTVNSQNYYSIPNTNRPVLQTRSINMPPPNIPVKRSIKFAPDPPKPVHLPRGVFTTSGSNEPPSSTQAFLEAHVDDFFPSPTQEIRELFGDVDDNDLPSNMQTVKETNPVRQSLVEEPVLPIISKPIFDYREDLENFFCTQDLAFSSQELAEITTPCRPLAVPKKILGQEPEPSKPKPRFFQEKDQDQIAAALYESKREAEQRAREMESRTQISSVLRAPPWQELQKETINAVKEVQKADSKTNRIPGQESERPKSRGPFFQEKEQDQLRAAIYESKREAEQRTQGSTDNRAQRSSVAQHRPRQEPQETTKPMNEIYEVPLQEDSKAPGRTLTRAESTATDYGDDDFCGCSQELLAIC